jgi:hypothetical protein
VIVAKEEHLERLRDEYGSLSKNSQDKSELIQQFTQKILQLEYSLKIAKEESDKKDA